MYNFYLYALMRINRPGPFNYGPYFFSHEPFQLGIGKDNDDQEMLYKARSEMGPDIFVQRYFDDAGITEQMATVALGRMMAEIEVVGTKNNTNSPLLKEQTTDGINSSENKYPYSAAGKALTGEHKKNISDALTGIVYPESRNKKISETMTGKAQPWNDENENSALSWIVSSPSGQISMINNLAKFCEKMGLNVSNLRMVAEHLREHHKGWKCKRGNLIGWNK